ncbi:AtpZ/AtpI family protein [Ancylobacter moscoviensis]|uniref:AtpZ/AtpI family protein n=1 Tax=Ancylobacter moscoviensis TaxID=2597768 RepID=UPI001FEEB1E4|nr:AtpZ/AtpI family protein [Ancylobacter moscoviensis]
MSWLLGLILDHTPWWLWLAVGLGILAATYQVWRPFWLLLPSPIKTALAALVAAGLAYLAGRNKGAAGALQRAQEQEQARADDIREKGARARERADRDAVSGRLRDDDGWKRRDG